MVDIHQREYPNENQFDAIREKAEREQLKPEGESAQATRDPGSVGGRSGNGQMKPHQSFNKRGAASGPIPPPFPKRPTPTCSAARDQSGATAIDREMREEERKQQESGKESSTHKN